MSVPQLTLTARVNPSAADARRGIVRVHPEVLAALSLREWDAVSIVGARRTAAVVAGAPDIATGTVLLDDITFSNAGIREDSAVVLQPVTVHGAAQVVVSGSVLASRSVDQATLRRALLGKVLSVGDAVSLLPRDLGPDLTASTAVRALARSVGITWTNELLTVSAVDPAGPVSVQTNTAVLWAGDDVADNHGSGTAAQPAPDATGPLRSAVASPVAGTAMPTSGVTRGWHPSNHDPNRAAKPTPTQQSPRPDTRGRCRSWSASTPRSPASPSGSPSPSTNRRCCEPSAPPPPRGDRVRPARRRQGHHGAVGVRGPGAGRGRRSVGGCAGGVVAAVGGVVGDRRATPRPRVGSAPHRRRGGVAARCSRTRVDADPRRAADRDRRRFGGACAPPPAPPASTADCATPSCATAS